MTATERLYQLIDADSHVNEPPGLWLERLPARFRDRAPRMQRFDEGDAWIFDGVDAPINFGLNAAAGIPSTDFNPWVRWEDIRPGGHDPKARLEEMDADRVDAAILYPTPRISHAVFGTPDPGFHLALVRAYNDWLLDFCSEDPSRLGAAVVLPNCGAAAALEEYERVAHHPGTRAALIGQYPHGGLVPDRDDDLVWRALSDTGVALHIHVGLVEGTPSGKGGTKVPGDLRLYDAPTRILQLIWDGAFVRFPDLQLVMVEVDCGWIPYMKEQADDRYFRMRLGTTYGVPRPPSHYFEHNISFTYISDHFGIRNRHDIGVERIMWSSDYPHVPANWPNSWRTIEAEFSGVPRDERDLILAGNAQRLYGFAAGAPAR